MRRAAVVLVLAACGKSAPPSVDAGPVAVRATGSVPASVSVPVPDAGSVRDAGSDAGAACPGDMALVDTSFCPDMERRCLDMEDEEKNNLEICHAYAHEQRCRSQGGEKRLAVCIDRYEYPDRKGAHPVWMLDWFDAQATCESRGKRLCLASEWTAACEGPDHTPFPYGWERDHDKCNMDNFYIDPRKPGPKAQFFFYSKDPSVAFPELVRLDQSVPSGSIETCRSGFGVYDMPGNVDEWVVNDGPPREKSRFAALKGGAWGHVRSACRPTTYSHEPDFTYYFVGFRCCRDPDGYPPETRWKPSRDAVPAPPVEPKDFAPEPIVAQGAPGPSKTKWSRTGRVE